jgi:photosystem II stability/assembly factor-like uncharacterized protein/long-subunit fatty acid transport protein
MRRTILLLFLIGQWVCVPSAAANWSNLGINGGHVLDIAIDPLNPDKLFASTYLGGGLFMSQDGGDSWQPLRMEHLREGEDTFEDQAVYAVAVAPGDSNVVWAIHNYWAARSTDGGQNWIHIPHHTMQSDCTNCSANDNWRLCLCLAIDPGNPGVAYVGTDRSYSGGEDGAVYKTVNGGDHWTRLSQTFDYRVEDLAVDPDNPSIVWAVTNSNGAGGWNGTIYRSANGGDTWQPITLGSPLGGIVAVAPRPDDPGDPDDPDMVFVACGYGVVLLTYNSTLDQWEESFPVTGSSIASDVVVAPSDPNVVYAGWKGSSDANLTRGVYNGDSWSWETFTLSPRIADRLLTLAVHPTDAERLFGGDASLGMLRSLDHGQEWTPVNQGLDAVVVYDIDVQDDDASHMIAASGSGLYEKPPDSPVWQRRRSGEHRSVEFEPHSAVTYYAGAYGHLMRTDNNGESWRQSNDLGGAFPYDIEIDPHSTDTVFITAGQQVMRSTDGGLMFDPVLTGVNPDGQNYRMNTVVIDPSDSRRLIAGGGNFFIPRVFGDMWESRDGGAAGSWQRTGLSGVVINAALIDPRDPNVMYAGCGYSFNWKPPLYKSIDGGVTWTAVNEGIPNARVMTYDIWASAPDDLYTVGREGTVYHYDGTSVSSMTSNTANDLYGVFGLSSSAVWAVGAGGLVLRYDGDQWSDMAGGAGVDLYSVWASGPNDLFAVGQGGTIRHFDGSAWSTMSSGVTDDLTEVFGTAADDVMAVSATGAFLHFDGDTWSPIGTADGESFNDIWALAADNYYAAGQGGALWHYDGSSWSRVDLGNMNEELSGIWGAAADDLYIAAGSDGLVLHYDGDTWTRLTIPGVRYAEEIWGVAADTIFVNDAGGGIHQYNGNQWLTLQASGTMYRSVTDLAFHGANPDILYAGTYKAGVYISPNQGRRWLDFGIPPSRVFALAAGSLHAATGSGVYSLTGTGVIAGNVWDDDSALGIDGAMVSTDLGNNCRSILGEYMMVVPAGIFDLFATAESYETASASGLTVTGSDVAWHNFSMRPGSGTLPSPGGGSGSGGSGCFIGSTAGQGRWSRLGGPAAALLAVVALLFGLKRSPLFFFVVTLALTAGALPPAGSRAATLFQQVGVASPPAPVGSGARALAMGGAFIATADDATAASWNPAGLIQLEKPELSAVGAYTDRYADYTSDHHPEISNSAHDRDLGLNYFSVTYPLSWRRNFVFSVNYQRLYDFERSFRHQFSYADAGLDLDQDIAYHQSGHIGAVGLAGAVELSPALSLGLTVNVWTDQLGWDNGWNERYRATSTGSRAGVPVTIDTLIEDRYEGFRGINANIGVLWETRRLGRFGAVVKTPFSATMTHTFAFKDTTTYGPPVDTTTASGPITTKEEVELQMPLAYGVGWSMRMGDAWTIGVDISRTHWNDYILTDGQGDSFSPIDGRPEGGSDIDPTTHVRLGGEYVVLRPHRQLAVPIRAGLFYDPEPNREGTQDFYGLALGGGVAWERSSVDLAYQLRHGPEVDSADRIAASTADQIQHTLLASLIYYF